MGRLRLAVAVAALAAVSAGASGPARAAEVGVVSDLNWGLTQTERDRTVAGMRELGAKWARIHLAWKDVEPVPGSYNVGAAAYTGAAIDAARGAGAKVVVMLYDAPAWATGGAGTAPRNPQDYANVIRWLATQYRGRVAGWEIWNEPNYSRFWSSPDPAAYAALLRAAYPAVKAADPGAAVVFGGLSTNDWQFLERAYAAGAKGAFDVLATHPYPDCGAAPETVRRGPDGRMTRGSFLAYRELRATMAAHGDPKPIWITELGWSTATTPCDPGAGVWVGGVTERVQADYLRRAFALLAQDAYVEAAMIYGFRNASWGSDRDEIESRYGLVRTDFSRKPAFDAVAAVARGDVPAAAPAPAVARPGKAKRASGRGRQVRLLSPAPGATFSSLLSLHARARGDQHLTRVEFWVNDRRVAVDRTPPFRATWRVRDGYVGRYRISAVAYGASGLADRHTAVVARRAP